MDSFKEEFLVGRDPQQASLDVGGVALGPGLYEALNLRAIEKEFDQAELRALSRSGLALRALTRRILKRTTLSPASARVGVYTLTHDGAASLPLLRRALISPTLKPSEMGRFLPPKLRLSMIAGLNAAQIAIEAQVRGPVVTVYPSSVAIDFVLEEILLDHDNGLIDQCFVAYATTYEDPTEWPEPRHRPPRERAVVMLTSQIDSETMKAMGNRLRKFFFDEVAQ